MNWSKQMDTQDDTQEVKLMLLWMNSIQAPDWYVIFVGAGYFFNVNGSFAQDVYIYLNK